MLGISVPTSPQVQMEILEEKQEEFLTAGYVVFEKSCPWVRQSLQFVQNQNIVKTRLVFLTINQNAEILLEGFNDRFSRYWMYWLFMNFNYRVSSSFEEPWPWVEVFSV